MTALYHPPRKGIQVDFHVQYLEFCCRSLGSSLGKGFVLVSHTCCQHCLPPSLKDSLNNLKHELIKWHLLWKQLFRWSMIIWGILCLQTPLLVQKSFRPVSLVCLRVSFCPYRIYRVSARTCRRTKSGSLTSDIHLDQGKNIHKPQGAWCRNCFQELFFPEHCSEPLSNSLTYHWSLSFRQIFTQPFILHFRHTDHTAPQNEAVGCHLEHMDLSWSGTRDFWWFLHLFNPVGLQ